MVDLITLSVYSEKSKDRAIKNSPIMLHVETEKRDLFCLLYEAIRLSCAKKKKAGR